MTNADLWSSYDKHSADLSNNARKLAFAGVAIAWFFKNDQNVFPDVVLNALLLFVVFFFFDILQYLLGAVILKFWLEKAESEMYEKCGSIDAERYEKPRWVDWPAFWCWLGKISALLIGYICLGLHIFSIQ